ncbi:hypothetical protein [Levilactobacillus spicheri]|uniref:Uncharacterized protein n=1 Tax=Levilactobacillus spicheri TaxID=216463 RepID=A0A0F3RS82_9LACO|nr:hypothetical protein [Levilactobacillus spicheri]KJW12469.1 hypothetical protein VC81_08225 [Levilactobacillus spicheri]GEO66407.1 hypothetical protein LSP04_08260 [Levilactobacillus spicheri]
MLLTRKALTIKIIFLSLFFSILFVGLVKFAGINPDGTVDVIQTFWGTLFSETFNFYKIIPTLTLLFTLFIHRPDPYTILIKLRTTSKIIWYYYQQIFQFFVPIGFSWVITIFYLKSLLSVNPENINFGIILGGLYSLNLLVYLTLLLLIIIHYGRIFAFVSATILLYADQWLHLNLGVSLLFYHGIFSNALQAGSDLTTVFGDATWNILLMGLLILVNRRLFYVYPTINFKEKKTNDQ